MNKREGKKQAASITGIEEALQLARKCETFKVDDHIRQIYDCLGDIVPEQNLEDFGASELELRQLFQKARLARAVYMGKRMTEKNRSESVWAELKDFRKFITIDHLSPEDAGITEPELEKLFKRSCIVEGDELLALAQKSGDDYGQLAFIILKFSKIIELGKLKLDEFYLGHALIKELLQTVFAQNLNRIRLMARHRELIPNLFIDTIQVTHKLVYGRSSILLWMWGKIIHWQNSRISFGGFTAPYYSLPIKVSEFKMYSHADEEGFFKLCNSFLEVSRNIIRRSKKLSLLQ